MRASQEVMKNGSWRLFLLPEPKGGIGRADHLSRLEVYGNDCYP